MNNKNTFENIIKNKIDQHEMEYDHADWLKLEKELPPSGGSPLLSGATFKLIAAIVVVAILATIAISTINNTEKEKAVGSQEPTPENQVTRKITPAPITIDSQQENLQKSRSEGKLETDGTHPQKIEKPEPKTEPLAIATKKESPRNDAFASTVDIEKTGETSNTPTAEAKMPNAEFSVSTTQLCALTPCHFYLAEKDKRLAYSWNFGDGTISKEMSPTHKFEEAGQYFVTLSVTDPLTGHASEWTNSSPIVVNPKPDASFIFRKEVNTYIFESNSTSFVNNSWQVDNESFTNQSLVEHTFIRTGTYNIYHICENEMACTDTINEAIDIQIEHPIQMPNAFSPNGDGRNDFFGPKNTNCCADYQYEMVIFNSMGILVFESNSPYLNWNGKIRGHNEDAQTGVYVYKVVTTDKYGNTQILSDHLTLTR